jgi:hypothetical protein
MNPLEIYLGASFLTLVYIGQIRWSVVEAGSTELAGKMKLSNVVFGGKDWFNRHWLFLMGSVVVPFLIATIPELPDLPVSFYITAGQGAGAFAMSKVVQWVAKFTINYLLVLITLECALAAAATGLTPKWRNLVVFAVIIDFLHYLFLTYVRHQASVQSAEMDGISFLSVAFLTMGFLSSIVASLAVVLPAARLNEERILG